MKKNHFLFILMISLGTATTAPAQELQCTNCKEDASEKYQNPRSENPDLHLEWKHTNPENTVMQLDGEKDSITVRDIDGNTYNTIILGTQMWMKENLKVKHYNNGDSIAHIKNNALWGSSSTGACCAYMNLGSNTEIYGYLYNFYAVSDSRKICPTGWRIPTDEEWTALSDFLGGSNIAGAKLKESGTEHWSSPNNGTNESGFTALPGGLRHYDGSFSFIGAHGSFWTCSKLNNTDAWIRDLYYETIELYRMEFSLKSGFSVRCLKDTLSGIYDRPGINNIPIYPNPFKDKIWLNTKENKAQEILIYNLAGNLIYKKYLEYNIRELDLSFLEAGIYVAEISYYSKKTRNKIVKI